MEFRISYITFTKSVIIRSAAKPLDKGNSGADTCRVQALRYCRPSWGKGLGLGCETDR